MSSLNGNKPSLTLLHALPGRIRVGLSHAPLDVDEMKAAVLGHSGLQMVSYTPVIRSLLVRFDQSQITPQEIFFRIALALSLQRDMAPVRIIVEPRRPGTSDSATLSGFLLLGAVATRLSRQDPKIIRPFELVAGLGTTYAVLDHGWREVRERGYFDPEVLSLGYLITAFLRGNFFKASVVTWLMTFGRHLLEAPRVNIELRPVEIKAAGQDTPRYEVVVGPDLEASDQIHIFDMIKGFLRYALTGGAAHSQRNLMDEFRSVSHLHGEVLHGLGRMSQGIPMHFK